MILAYFLKTQITLAILDKYCNPKNKIQNMSFLCIFADNLKKSQFYADHRSEETFWKLHIMKIDQKNYF